jgi:peptidoglycan/LPS O-acetylase OafA/YrhL
MILGAHVALVGGTASYGIVSRWTQQNDLSYGTYIYGWPIQQAIMLLWPGIGLWTFVGLSILCVVPHAYAPWKLVEHPILQFVRSRRRR